MNVVNIAIIGSGGREDALAQKFSKEEGIESVWVLPGNFGMNKTPKVQSIPMDISRHSDVLEFCYSKAPELIVIGPEACLASGLVNDLEKEGFKVYGPSKEAALLESSKIFSKELMTEMSIRTAPFRIYDSYEQAMDEIKSWDFKKGVVLKADSLAAGKGVVVTHEREVAEKTLYDFMVNPDISVKTERILVEEKLVGREASAFALCDGSDGDNFYFLGFACDYKRLLDGDKGPNTGGMGGYYSKSWPSSTIEEEVKKQIIQPILKGMKKRGSPFKGTLFVGLMIDDDGNPSVIEFNVRFGDPETQVLIPLLKGDLHKVLLACVEGCISEIPNNFLSYTHSTSVHVALVSQGYPTIDKVPMLLNQKIAGNFENLGDNIFCYFAGVKEKDGYLVNSGGRVLGFTGIGESKEICRQKVYSSLKKISFLGNFWRNDIAK